MKHVHIQSIDNVYQNKIDMIRLRLNKGWDYVWFAFDERGFLTITSSYGTWSYIWSAMGEGVTLSQFFQKANEDYLANKLIDREKREVFDSDDAFKDMRRSILLQRRDGSLTKDQARDLVKATQEVENDYDSNYENDRSRFFDAYFSNDELHAWDQHPYEFSWGMRPSSEFRVLKEEIIPLIKRYFRGEVKPDEATA